jgi:hypothetical protein
MSNDKGSPEFLPSVRWSKEFDDLGYNPNTLMPQFMDLNLRCIIGVEAIGSKQDEIDTSIQNTLLALKIGEIDSETGSEVFMEILTRLNQISEQIISLYQDRAKTIELRNFFTHENDIFTEEQ